MKRVIKATDVYEKNRVKETTAEQNKMRHGIHIYDLMKQLFDAIEDTDDDFFEEYDLNVLYEELGDTLHQYSNQLFKKYSQLRDAVWDEQ